MPRGNPVDHIGAPVLLACNTQRIWPATEVTLSFPGRLVSGRTGGHGTRFDPSRLDLFFSAGKHSGRLLNGAGFPPHPSKPHDHVSGPLCSRVLDRRSSSMVRSDWILPPLRCRLRQGVPSRPPERPRASHRPAILESGNRPQPGKRSSCHFALPTMWWFPCRQKKQQSSRGGKAPGIRRHCLTDPPNAFDFAVANTAGQFCPAASIHSSGHEYHEPEGDADRDAAGSGVLPAAGAGSIVKGRAGTGTGDRSGTHRW